MCLLLVVLAASASAAMTGTVWNNGQLTGFPAYSFTTTTISFTSSSDPPSSSSRVVGSPWSVRWSGLLTVPTSFTYQFCLTVDDGARFYLGCPLALLIESWQYQGATKYCTNSMYLIGGSALPFVVEWNNVAGGGSLSFTYSSGSTADAVVPESWITDGPSPGVCPSGKAVESQPLNLECPTGYGITTVTPKSSYGLPSVIYANDFSTGTQAGNTASLYLLAGFFNSALRLLSPQANARGHMIITPPSTPRAWTAKFRFNSGAVASSVPVLALEYGGPTMRDGRAWSAISDSNQCVWEVSCGRGIAIVFRFYENTLYVFVNGGAVASNVIPNFRDGIDHWAEIKLEYNYMISVTIDSVRYLTAKTLDNNGNALPSSDWLFVLGARLLNSVTSTLLIEDFTILSLGLSEAQTALCSCGNSAETFMLQTGCSIGYGVKNVPTTAVVGGTGVFYSNNFDLGTHGGNSATLYLSASFSSGALQLLPATATVSGLLVINPPVRELGFRARFRFRVANTAAVGAFALEFGSPTMRDGRLWSSITNTSPCLWESSCGNGAAIVFRTYENTIYTFNNGAAKSSTGTPNYKDGAWHWAEITVLSDSTTNVVVDGITEIENTRLETGESTGTLWNVQSNWVFVLGARNTAPGNGFTIDDLVITSIPFVCTNSPIAPVFSESPVCSANTTVSQLTSLCYGRQTCAITAQTAFSSAPCGSNTFNLTRTLHAGAFCEIRPPQITGILPVVGVASSAVTIRGYFFLQNSSALAVTVGGFNCAINASLYLQDQIICTPTWTNPAGGFYPVVVTRSGQSISTPYPTYEIIREANLTSLSPTGGTVGSLITISGANFGSSEASLAVTIGGSPAVVISGSLNAFGTIVVVQVPQLSVGTVLVTLSVRGIAALNSRPLTYILPPVIVSLSAASVSAAGTLSINATGLGSTQADISVVIGGLTATISTFTVASSSALVSVVVPGLSPGVQTVRVTRYGVASNSTTVTISPPVGVAVYAVSPLGIQAGSLITIQGGGFGASEGALSVTVVGVGNCPVVSGSLNSIGTQVVCTVPSGGSLGVSYPVQVTVGTSATGPSVTYLPTPTISILSPAGGQQGTVITLLGTNFGASEAALSIMIGSATCPVVAGSLWLNGTRVSCVQPSLPIGDVAVTVRVYNIENAAPKPTFSVVEQPRLLSVSPVGGPVSQRLTLVGSALGCSESAISITVGTSAAPCAIVAGSLQCADPAQVLCDVVGLAAGVHSVNVVRYGTVGARQPLPQYEAVSAGAVTSVLPAGGTASTELSVFGSGFGSDESRLVVTVGSQTCSMITGTLNALGTSFRCLAPAQSVVPSVQTVQVSRLGVAAVSATVFQYVQQPTLVGVSPSSGSVGSVVTLSGVALYPDVATAAAMLAIGQLRVTVGGVAATVDNSSLATGSVALRFVAPSVGGVIGPQLVVLSLFGVASAGVVQFSYVAQPVIASVAPGVVRSGSSITLRGSNFGVVAEEVAVTVTFANSDSGACNVTGLAVAGAETLLVCTVPVPSSCAALSGVALWACASGSASVTLARVGIQAVAPVSVTMYSNSTASGVSPSGGLSGSTLTVSGAGFGTVESAISVTAVASSGGGAGIGCAVQSVSNSAVVCRLDDSAAGVWNLTVTRYGFAAEAARALLFEVVDQPRLQSFTPLGAVVDTLGSVVLTLTGSLFGSDESSLSVTVESTSCTILPGSLMNVFGVSTVRCSLDPSGLSVGSHLVSLTRYGASTTAQRQFSAVLQHRIDTVVPQGGEVGRETVISISPNNPGSGPSEWQVFLGSVAAPIFSFDSLNTEITISVPDPTLGSGIATGVFPISVVRFGYVASANTVNFGFVQAALIESISPSGGSNGTVLTVVGANMGTEENAVSVTVGGEPCIVIAGSLLQLAPPQSQVLCSVPLLAPGLHDVVLLSYGLSVPGVYVRFQSVLTPQLNSLSPRGGPSNGTVTLTLLGQHFGSSEGVFNVTVGGVPCELVAGSLNSAGTTAQCVAAGNGRLGDNFGVQASVFGVGSPDPLPVLSFVLQPVILDVQPLGGAPGSKITLTGKNFGNSDAPSDLSVLISDETGGISAVCVVVPGTLVFDAVSGISAVQCTLPELELPSGASSAALLISLSVFGVPTTYTGASGGASVVTLVSQPAVVEAAEPRFTRPGTLLTLTGSGFVSTSAKSSNAATTGISVLVGTYPCTVVSATTRRVIVELPLELSKSDYEVSVSQFGVKATGEVFFVFVYERPEYVRWSSGVVAAYLVFSGILVFSIVPVLCFYWWNRAVPIIRRQQPLFCALTLLGCIMAIFSIMPLVGRPTSVTCGARMWVPPLAFTLVYGPLFAKTWRIYRIFNNPSLKTIVITNTELCLKLFMLLLIDVVLVALWFSESSPAPMLKFHDASVFATCSSSSKSIYPALLFAEKFGLLIFGAVLAFQTRSVRSAFNESKYIAFTLYNQLFVAALVAPIVVSISDPDLGFGVLFTGIFIIIAATVGILFLRTVLMLIRGEEPIEQDSEAATRSTAHLRATASLSGVCTCVRVCLFCAFACVVA
eukprot:TRINITY_DN406_c0_g1_i4.p1 TRINITY_DN406_c0_g1~~TRINITY_DN406_c0_g1_i4.p1  ORF type:complete len:2538 (+),score=464.25 TRINITY_DN406_c0_g1_i4:68-7681(+)